MNNGNISPDGVTPAYPGCIQPAAIEVEILPLPTPPVVSNIEVCELKEAKYMWSLVLEYLVWKCPYFVPMTLNRSSHRSNFRHRGSICDSN